MSAAVADALVVAAWMAVALVDVRTLARERDARRHLAPPVAGGRRLPRAAVALLLAGAAAGFVIVEHAGGRLPFSLPAAVAGLALVATGVALHTRARAVLGPCWSGTPTVRAGHPVVARGPYAVVRHPLYASFLLLAAGSTLVHPSVAVGCAALGCALGIALKIPVEERLLRRALGGAYADYATRVPALVPRVRRGPIAGETDRRGA